MSDTVTEADEMQVGQRVILTERAGYATVRSVVAVTRRTKTHVIVEVGGKERRFSATGFHSEVGSSGYFKPSIKSATPELIAAVVDEHARARAIRRIREAKLESFTTAQLEAIAAALPD